MSLTDMPWHALIPLALAWAILGVVLGWRRSQHSAIAAPPLGWALLGLLWALAGPFADRVPVE